jgi:hypothetical protein
MSASRVVDFAGTDAELEKLLREFAGATWGKASPARDGGWLLSFGSLLSTNPNDLSFRVRVTREGHGVALRPSAIVAPWTRAKAARIVAFREGQLAAHLAARGTRPADPEKLREPFASWGSGPAAVSASFAWVAAAGLLALLLSTIAVALATLPLLGVTVDELKTRTALLATAGADPLPTAAELGRAGVLFRLGAAFVGGFPLAFFAGLLHVLALAAGESTMRASRVPQASFAFLVILLTLAFFPFTPILALPCALLVPAAAHAGYTAVWSRRLETPRVKPRPRPAVVAAGLAFAIAALAFMAPAAAFGEDMTFRIALFRDRALLGSPFGKAVALAYYRTTLYAAWPVKEFFSDPPGRPTRGQRTAVAATPEAAAALKQLAFTIVPEGSAADVVVKPDGLEARGQRVELRVPAEPELRKALDLLSRDTFRGGMLREANSLGWTSIYFAGPPAVILLVIGLCCPFVSIMYRAMSAKAATIALGVCVGTTLVLMAVANAAIGGLASSLENLRKHPTPDGIRRALGHASVVFRHEGAVLAYERPDPSLGDALLQAADDPDLRVRLWACAALGRTKHEKALPKLLDRLEDVELFVRYRAAEGLGHLGDRRAIEPLRRMMRENSWYEGVYALEALRRIGP